MKINKNLKLKKSQYLIELEFKRSINKNEI